MAGTELTYNKVLEAARRLPPAQRRTLVEELISVPARSTAVKVARRLRPAFRLPAKREKLLSSLLQKGNAGTLTHAEKTELSTLVEEVLDKREQLAKAVGKALANRKRSKSRNGAAER